MPRTPCSRLGERFPLGLLVIIGIAAVSSLLVALRPETRPEGRVMWTFIRHRVPVYEQVIGAWNLEGRESVRIELVEFGALTRRLLSGFVSGTPLADIVEIERGIAAALWRGPLEAVGFVDLTERLHAEGFYARINAPSFSPWTNRGRIFGLPADVHPVLLCYRADVFEAAGIEVGALDTWEKFFAATRGLVRDLTGDGRPDQYVFELQESDGTTAAVLMLQAGGELFDTRERPALNSPVNVRVLARLAEWASGPGRVTGDLDLFTGAGHQLRVRGYVLSWLVPDWRSKHNELYAGELAGKLKLMPLPAWEPGGRRTSCWGGTMLGFPKSSPTFAENWEFAKRLYLSRELAVRSWREFGVVTPMVEFWDDPVYDEPSAYYSGQPAGRLFLQQAPAVPLRSSSPYYNMAVREVGSALAAVVRASNARGGLSAAELEPLTRAALDRAQGVVERQMRRNRFSVLAEGEGAP